MPNKKISEIKPSDIRKWQNELISTGMKDTSLRTMHAQLTALFNYAVKFHGLRINPCKIAGTIGKTKREAEDLSFWTIDDFNEAIKVMNEEVCKISLIVLFYTGIRSGELRALTWGDINLEKMEIHINKTVVESGAGFEINKPKTSKGTRIISLPQKVNDALVKWKEKQYKATSKMNVFPINRHTLRRRIDNCSNIANLPKIRIHDLRHSHASLLIELGVNVIEISERLGHENIQTTLNTYSHLYPNKQKEVAEKINKLAFDWL
jgi:integrase